MPVSFKRESNAPAQIKRLETRQQIAEKVARLAAAGVECTATTTTKLARKYRGESSGAERKRATGARRTSIKRSGNKYSRTAAENIVIYRSQKKRLGARRLGTTGAERKAILRATEQLRMAAKAGTPGAAQKYGAAIAAKLAEVIRGKIVKEKLVDTGQLRDSVIGKADNI